MRNLGSLLIAIVLVYGCDTTSYTQNNYQVVQNATKWAIEKGMYPSNIECYHLNQKCGVFVSSSLPAVVVCGNQDGKDMITTTCQLTPQGEIYLGTDNIP
jgi:hypothetical protein